MISPECFYDQYKHAFNYAINAPKKILISEQLEGFYRMAAELRQQPLPELEYVTMTYSPSFPVDEDTVLVPISGGLVSTACLWWVLKQGYKPWLFFLDGFNAAANDAEREAVRKLVLCTCGQDGLPLCTEDSRPRLVIRPYPYNAIADDSSLRMAMLYFMTQEVAKTRRCSRIVWGALGVEQQLLKTLVPFFTQFDGEKGTELINSVFPFSSPEQAMLSIQECQLLSQKVQQMCLPGERLNGAAMCSDLRSLCHSCKGSKRPCLEKENRCIGCSGCEKWKAISIPSWQWSGTTTSAELADWRPNLQPSPRSHTPSWTGNVKRQAVEAEISRRRKEAEEEDRLMAAAAPEPKNKSKSKKTAKTMAVKRPAPTKSKGKPAKKQAVEDDLFAAFAKEEDGPLLGDESSRESSGDEAAEAADKDVEQEDADKQGAAFDVDQEEEADEEEGDSELEGEVSEEEANDYE
jgi:hypothetical protein